jgi:RsiW-degrading membrane proteinase PrsW (M82 family)
MTVCSNCGAAGGSESRFCQSCGSRLGKPDVPSPSLVELRCVSGPDAGRIFSVGTLPAVLGRSAGIGHADPAVADNHVMVNWQDGGLHFRVFEGRQIDVDGLRATDGVLFPAQRFRMGASTWEVGRAPSLGNMVEALATRLNRIASTDKLEGFSLREMFSEVFQRRTPEEIDACFAVGTARTTPRIEDVETGWPKPWFFLRVLGFVALIYLGFTYGWEQFRNTNLIPGLILMGSTAMPLATVFLFWEMNTPRNVSFHRVLMMVCLGGIVSLIVSLFGFQAANLSWLGASQAGIVEEAGKLLAVVMIVRHSRYQYILNGMLFGAAAGAGFAIFESAGYAFNVLLEYRSGVAMQANIQMRALLSPFGHVAWTAITAGALWRARHGGPLTAKVIGDVRFWRAFLIPVVLHMIWNSPLPSLMNLKYLVPGLIAWFVVFGLVQQGLLQVRQEQIHSARAILTESRRLAGGVP